MSFRFIGSFSPLTASNLNFTTMQFNSKRPNFSGEESAKPTEENPDSTTGAYFDKNGNLVIRA